VSRPLSDRVVIITGASSGIGAELARQIAGQGAWLVLAARREHELDVVAQECIAHGGRTIIVPTDVTDPAQCEHLVARTVEAYGRIDVLINNAGIGAHFRFADTTDVSVFDRVMRVNYLGSVYCTHYALPALRQVRGRIAVISSLAGKTGVPSRAAYAASKHALQGFFESLRIELDGTGVTVTLVNPGFVRSSIRAHALGADGAPLGESHLDESSVMPVEECVRRAVRAIERREREVVMRDSWKLLSVLKAIAPGLIDRMAAKAVNSK
jgi:short-subunit dehydrogenase